MSGSSRETGNDILFDLPLGRSGDSATALEEAAPESVAGSERPASVAAHPDFEPAPTEWLPHRRVTAGDRLTAGGLDLGVAAAVLTIVLAACRWMGVAPGLDAWPGFAAFLLAFSFLYFVIPLSFWGQTPGMSWAGIIARWEEDLPLSFGQSTLRWIGTVLSLLLLGLPLVLGERTLADRISGTTTMLVDSRE